MSLCPVCGVTTMVEGVYICPYHGVSEDVNWAVENRIWCDYIHRKVEIPRMDANLREPGYPTNSAG